VVSALFPFQPALDAVEAAIGGSEGLGLALAHLAVLTLGFGVVGRLALRRFG